MYEKYRKKKEYEVLSEDNEFCYLQVVNRGAIKYSTGKIAVPSNSCLQVFHK